MRVRKDLQSAKSGSANTVWFRWAKGTLDSAPAELRPSVPDAVDEYDSRLEAGWEMLFLHRASIAAPLLGVILTAWGFLGADFLQDDQLDVSAAVRPLMKGVFVGACLALLNQALLFWIEKQAEQFKSKAARWYQARLFDIASNDASQNSLILALDNNIVSMKNIARQNKAAAKGISITHGHLQMLGETLSSAGDDFSAQTGRVKNDLSRVLELLHDTASEVGGFKSILNKAFGQFDTTIQSFSETFERDFAVLSSEHVASSKELTKSAESLSSVMDSVRVSGDELNNMAKRQLEATTVMEERISMALIPANHAVASSAERIEAAVEAIAGPLLKAEDGLTSLLSFAEDASENIKSLDDSAGLFSSAVQTQFIPATTSQQETAETTAQIVREVAATLGRLESAARALARATTAMETSSEQYQESVTSNAIPSHESLQKASASFDATTGSLAEQVKEVRSLIAEYRTVSIRQSQQVEASIDRLADAATRFVALTTQYERRRLRSESGNGS
jgi:hypothetical protein